LPSNASTKRPIIGRSIRAQVVGSLPNSSNLSILERMSTQSSLVPSRVTDGRPQVASKVYSKYLFMNSRTNSRQNMNTRSGVKRSGLRFQSGHHDDRSCDSVITRCRRVVRQNPIFQIFIHDLEQAILSVLPFFSLGLGSLHSREFAWS